MDSRNSRSDNIIKRQRLPVSSSLLPPLFLLLPPLFLSVLLVTDTTVEAASKMLTKKPGCNQSEMIRVDRLVARLMPFGPKGRLMPQNETQLVRFCEESRNLTMTVEDFFGRCFTRDTLQTSKLAMYPPKRSVQQFCGTSLKDASKIGLPFSTSNSTNSSSPAPKKPSKRLEKILRITPCVNKHLRRNDTCLKRFVTALRTVMLTVDDERLKLPHLCCSAVDALHCLEDMLGRKACSRSPANREVILDFMTTSSADFFGVACGDFNDSSDRCSSLPPLNVTLVNANLIGNGSGKSTGKLSKRAKSKQKRLKQSESRRKVKSLAQMNFITPVFLVIDLLSNLGG
ncbi:hypothetical protein TYRP_009182 [Tyrophagus putrescentiae]|nr:hypothetical protein TYRP_009182 [Tyrophagus putrescentiae]